MVKSGLPFLGGCRNWALEMTASNTNCFDLNVRLGAPVDVSHMELPRYVLVLHVLYRPL